MVSCLNVVDFAPGFHMYPFFEVETGELLRSLFQGMAIDVFPEKETAEILAASWKEKRAEIARLQHPRKFNQASKKFIGEV